MGGEKDEDRRFAPAGQFEMGLNDPTKDETTIRVHYGMNRTKQVGPVRIEQLKA